MDYIVNVLVVVASLVVLFFAYFKKSELGKLSVFVIFSALLLQSLIGILVDWALFDFIVDFLNSLSTIVVYAELVLLIILLVTRYKKANKALNISLLVLIILQLIAILGIF